MTHLELPVNKVGRDFFVGDIHGRFDLLEDAMKAVAFNPDTDRIIAVGDLVDRGPYSGHVLDWLSRPYFYTVRGNHEDMWLLSERNKFLASYAWYFQMSKEKQKAFQAMVKELPYAITIGDIGVCHANTPVGMTWQRMVEVLPDPALVEIVTWDYVEDYTYDRPIKGIQYVIHGHTIFDRPTRIGQHLYIDTGAFYTNRLTFATLDDLLRVRPT